MVRGELPLPLLPIHRYTGATSRQGRGGEDVIDPETVPLRERQHPVVPPGPRPRALMVQPDRVDQPPIGNGGQGGTRVRMAEDRVGPLLGPRRIPIFRGNVESPHSASASQDGIRRPATAPADGAS